MARPLASLMAGNLAWSLEQILGEDYAAAKVNLTLHFSQGVVGPELPPSRALDILPHDLKLSTKDQLVIISLFVLDEERQKQLEQKISSSSTSADIDVKIIKWDGPTASRAELYQIYELQEANSVGHSAISYGFYVDPVLQDSAGLPRVIAMSRRTTYALETDEGQLVIVPIRTESIIAAWQTALHGIGSHIKSVEYEEHTKEVGSRNAISLHEQILKQYCDLPLCEHVYDPRVAFEQGNGSPPTVWFLRDFTDSEQRQIRHQLGAMDEYDLCDHEHEFFYMGYPFPDEGTVAHTVEDLRDLFQKSDPYSPFYDPSHSSLRMSDYPQTFVAIDDMIFSEKDSRVHMAGTLDLYFDGAELGWFVGTTPPSEAYGNWQNLDTANAGPEDLFEDSSILWLSDLKDFKPQYEVAGQDLELDY